MMVNRAHLEDLSVEFTYRYDLYCDGADFYTEEEADGNDIKDRAGADAEREHEPSEEVRAYVAHEDGGGVAVVPEEAEAERYRHKVVQHRRRAHTGDESRQRQKRDEGDERAARGEAVEAVGHVDGVLEADAYEGHDRYEYDERAHHAYIGVAYMEVHPRGPRQRYEYLERELLLAREAVARVPPVFQPFVGEADRARENRI